MKLRSALPTILGFCALAGLSAPIVSAAAVAYDVDPVHSSVIFRAQHFKAGFTYGRFDKVSGAFAFDEAKPEASSVKVQVEVASIDTNDKQRDSDLLTPDYLDVAAFPTIRFESTGVKRSADGAYEVTGNLTLHGVTKSVSVVMTKSGEADDKWGAHRLGFEGTLTVQRSQYGMDKHLDGVGDEIRLILAIEGTRKK
jgi:polyisoprenoid-binding protein YceI